MDCLFDGIFGFTRNERICGYTFKVLVIFLAAVGVILTPIYLLSNLREIFYGEENKELVSQQALVDAEPREVFIIACLLVPIIGIGLYPKVLTQIYDSTTVQLTARLRESVPTLVQPAKVAQGNAPVAAMAPMIGER